MSAGAPLRRRKRDRRGHRGGLEDRGRLETILAPRELEEAPIGPDSAERAENGPRESPQSAIGDPSRGLDTQVFELTARYELTAQGRAAVRGVELELQEGELDVDRVEANLEVALAWLEAGEPGKARTACAAALTIFHRWRGEGSHG